MMRVWLEFDVRLTPNEPVSGSPADLQLCVHLDREMAAVPPVPRVHALRAASLLRQGRRLTLVGLCGGDGRKQALPADAAVCFQLFRRVRNKQGDRCMQDCGARTVLLRSLNEAGAGGLQVPLRIHTAPDHVATAVLELTAPRLRLVVPARGPGSALGGAGQSDERAQIEAAWEGGMAADAGEDGSPYAYALQANAEEQLLNAEGPGSLVGQTLGAPWRAVAVAFESPAPASANVPENVQNASRLFGAYVEGVARQQGALLLEYHRGTKRIQCPLNPGEVTLANTQVSLPFASYTLYEVPRTLPAWWRREFCCMARRRGFGGPEAYGAWLTGEATPAQQAAASMDWCTQFPQLLPYMPDMLGSERAAQRGRGRAVEMFGEALAMLSGDCEDTANAILMLRDALRALPPQGLAAAAGGRPEAEAMLLLQRRAAQYWDVLCIDGVTATHAAADELQAVRGRGVGGKNRRRLVVTEAHCAVHALPLDYAAACAMRGCPSREHPIYAHFKRLSASWTPQERRMLARLPTLVGEGTAVIDTGAAATLPDARLAALREAVAAASPAFAPLKRDLSAVEADGGSDFYKLVLFGCSNAFVRDLRIGTFHFAQKARSAVGAGDMDLMRGVPFRALHGRSDSVALVPYAPRQGAGPTQREFSTEQLAFMRRAVKNRLPPPPLVVFAGGQGMEADDATAQNGLAQHLESWRRRLNQQLPGEREGVAQVVNLYPRSDQLTRETMLEIERAVRSLRATIDVPLRAVRLLQERHHPLCEHVCVQFVF